MPDWTYHPFFKPLLFRMSPENGRRLTLRLLEIQARTAVGRRIFQLFGHGVPPEKLAVEAFGVRFPGPIGLAPGIDTHGIALPVLQYLGLGFLCVGPAGSSSVARRFARDPLRIEDRHAIVSSTLAGAPSTAEIARRIGDASRLAVPVGFALRGEHFQDAARGAESVAAFFILPASAALDRASILRVREATKKPSVLRLPGEAADDEIDRIVDTALEIGIDGAVVLSGVKTSLLEEGELTGPTAVRRALDVTERLAKRHGKKLPIIGSTGVMSPSDVLRFLDAGATLVELYEGLVYAGPGLPGRIIHALEHRSGGTPAKSGPSDPDSPLSRPSRAARRAELAKTHKIGVMLQALTGSVLILSGVVALILAATIKLFPYDTRFLGMTVDELCARNACRIVHFMAHDRVSFGGSIISIGAVYLWLALGPLARGEAWAWWTFLLSGVTGFGSFLTYLGYGYLDVWHGRATIALLVVYLVAMVLSFSGLERPRGPVSLFRAGSRAWFYSPAGLGRSLLTFSAVGMILGGATIMTVGVSRVFVPQDLEYMGITVDELRAISPRLVPLIAHDRAGFGGGLLSGGLTILFTIWCGARPGAKWLWWALCVAGVVGFGCAILIHPIVGYTSFIHLAPAYAGALAFVLGIRLLYGPLCKADPGGESFPDV